MIKDHTGREFPSIIQMCKFWGITAECYDYRKNRARPRWELEKILTTPVEKRKRREKIRITPQPCPELDQWLRKPWL